MTALALGFSLAFVAGGAWVAIAPASVLGWLRERVGWALVAWGCVLRLVVGFCFFFAGLTARWPDFIQWMGILTIVSGVGLPLVGPERLRSILAWVTSLGTGFFRVGGVVAIALGIALVLGLSP